MNIAVLIGRLTADPEMRVTTSGKSVCSFTLAVDRAYKVNGETKADFLRVQAWGNLADNCGKYLQKGRQVAVRGEIHIDKANDKYYTTINADTVRFLGQKTGQAESNDGHLDGFGDIQDEDLPF